MPNPNPRTSAHEKQQRVDVVYGWLIDGLPRHSILEKAKKGEGDKRPPWDVSNATIDSYIAAARKQLVKDGQTRRDVELGKAVRRLERIFNRAFGVQDYQRALAAQRELNLLLGLNAAVKTAHSGTLRLDVQQLPPLADDDLDRILD